MTNSYDVDHGLSQDAPGPLEPVELAQQDDTLARTGNTARDQEMYDAGIRIGEENAKHNAAIRAGAAPGVSTVEDAGAQKEAVMDAIADALGEAYDCTRVWHAWSYGTMGPDDFALVAADPSRVAEIATAAIAAMRPAPAAGDALDLTLAQKYEDACILANANARDAARYRQLRKALTSYNTGWLDRIAAALEAMGLDPDEDKLPTPEQVDDAFDAAQRKGDA
ncbi:hypothetical protein AADG64_09505 [Achromobacter xylosoxidans]|uniref:hypothetical protein n=1 Tax=Alcaligenes xylosoxydans xylosoxydans TaxID=85698 RepID=UPI00336A7AC6